MRAAIYARFSSDLQDLRSIADQVDLARRYAEARSLDVVDVYDDAAISGASTLNRPGLLRLIADAQARRFDVIVTESLDRLSRSQADIAALYERLQFLGVRIETLADGAVSEIHVGLKGTMSALFLKDLAQKTRRGQIGRVKAGRKRISRENPEREWHRQAAPELRIVDDRTWELVQCRRVERGGPHLYQQRRPQRPLSGLIYCGACGARFIVATHDYLRCSARTNRGTCETSRTLLMSEVKQRVLSALRSHLLSPDVLASAVDAYHKERKRVAEERRRSRHKLEAAAAEVERKISRLLMLVENGHADAVATGPRINELGAERKRLAAELSRQPAPNVVEFFPKAAERYRQKVEDIHAALSRGEAGDREAIALVRSLIGRIVVHATPAPEPLGLEVEGSLAALMSDAPELEHSGISCCRPPQPP